MTDHDAVCSDAIYWKHRAEAAEARAASAEQCANDLSNMLEIVKAERDETRRELAQVREALDGLIGAVTQDAKRSRAEGIMP